MPLEEEMRHEIIRLEKELEQIDLALKKLNNKIFILLDAREKREHDLRILKEGFETPVSYDVEDIEKILKGRRKLKV